MLHIGSNFVTTDFAIYIFVFDRYFFVNIQHSILLCNQIFSMFALKIAILIAHSNRRNGELLPK